MEVEAGGKTVDRKIDGFVESRISDHEELNASGATLANDGGLPGEGFVFLVRMPGGGNELVTGGRGADTEFSGGRPAKLIEKGEAVLPIGRGLKFDCGVGGAYREMAAAVWKDEVIVGSDFLVLCMAVLVGNHLFDYQEGIGRLMQACGEKFDPKQVIFFGRKGMITRRF